MINRGVYFLAEKSEIFQKFMEFRSLVENETYKVKAKKTMFEDRLWGGIHITGVGAYLKRDSQAVCVLLYYTAERSRGEEESTSWRNRIHNANNVQPGRMHDD